MLVVIVLAIIIKEIMPQIQLMCISSAIYQLPYFFFGILYCVCKETIDKYLWKYWYLIVPIFGLLSVSLLLPGRLAAIAGIIFCTTGGLLLANKIGIYTIRLSQYTYTVFLLAYFPQMFVRGPVAHHLLPNVNQYWLSALSFTIGLILPLLFCEIFTRIRGNSRIMSLIGRLIGL